MDSNYTHVHLEWFSQKQQWTFFLLLQAGVKCFKINLFFQMQKMQPVASLPSVESMGQHFAMYLRGEGAKVIHRGMDQWMISRMSRLKNKCIKANTALCHATFRNFLHFPLKTALQGCGLSEATNSMICGAFFVSCLFGDCGFTGDNMSILYTYTWLVSLIQHQTSKKIHKMLHGCISLSLGLSYLSC